MWMRTASLFLLFGISIWWIKKEEWLISLTQCIWAFSVDFGEKVKTSQVGVNPSLSLSLSLRVSSTRVSISTACIARFDPFAYPLSMVVERAARSGATSGGAGAGGCFTHTRPALGVPHHQIQALYASCLMIITEPQGTESIIMKKPRASRTIESNWVKTLLATAKHNTQCAECAHLINFFQRKPRHWSDHFTELIELITSSATFAVGVK